MSSPRVSTRISPFLAPRPRRVKGIAIVLVLACIVILTGLVFAFFSRAITERQVANRSADQSNADILARSATDIIVGDLKQEIVDGSLPSPTGYKLYVPTRNTYMLPQTSGTPSPGPGTAPPLIPNLVRRSVRDDPLASLSPPSPAIHAVTTSATAVNSTTDASANGRTINLARWNSHYLVPRLITSTAIDSTPVAAFTPPDWVVVTSNGPKTITNPDTATIGRYAYAIYDEGGLLDLNVAGYPSSITPAQAGSKTTLAFADLTQIGIPNPNSSKTPTYQVDNIIGWRNFATVQPDSSQSLSGNYDFHNAPSTGTRYHNFLLGVTNGFLSANPQLFPFPVTTNSRTDQVFTSRQALLKFRRSTGFSQNALQYLSTFSRDINAPTWSPSKVTDSTIDYESLKDDPASANRDLGKVRVTSSFTRPDGTLARAGEPLLKTRFPLRRLGGLGPNGVLATAGNTTLVNGILSPASASTVQRDFGLIWGGGHWDYCGPTGTTIATSIATLGSIGSREPNFFELLKAGILIGSLGRDAGATGTYNVDFEEGPSSGVEAEDRNADYQIIRIGANIIDQYDSDSYPTEIRFNNANTVFYGVENLPYIQRVFAKTLYSEPITEAPKISGWYMAELWNPHQDFGYASAAPPSEFRFRGEGPSKMWTLDANGAEAAGPTLYLRDSGSVSVASTATVTFREPTLIGTNVASVANDGPNGINAPEPATIGLYSGSVLTINKSGGISPQGCDLLLEYKDPSGRYRIYQRMKNFVGKEQGEASKAAFYYQHVDPRTDRFGTTLGQWTYASSTHPPSKSLRPTADQGWNSYGFFPRKASGFIYTSADSNKIFNNFFMGTLSDNVTESNPRYADRDGVLRSAEGNYATTTGISGRPLITGNDSSRPIVLNRPFRNVGELGYVFRDLPWKNVDFFTTNSGDAGLLDIFSISETTSEHAMVAGRVNLNTRQATVLQSIVAGAVKNEVTSPVSVVSDTDAGTIGSNVVAWTGSPVPSRGPFMNRSELLTKGGAVLQGSGTSSTAMADQQIKTRRETALRALSEVSTTRTWNLMIDVIAQSGRYAPGETGLKKFVVSGEKRYWLHVAIDRYTGEVIDRILESVNE